MRRFRSILLAGVMAVALCGCGGTDSVNTEPQTTVAEATSEAETTTEEATTAASSDTEMMELLKKNCEEEVRADKLSTMELEGNITVAVPMDGEAISGDMEGAASSGVGVSFVINPKERNGKEDSPIYEALRKYIKGYYDGGTDFESVEINLVEDINDEIARSEVTYVDASGKKAACDGTWYLFDLNDETSLFMCVEVNYSKADDNTEAVIEALEEYYEINIVYDEAAAKERMNSGSQTVNYKGFQFTLPIDWALDESMEMDGAATFAPGGSVEKALCGITIYQGMTLGDNDIKILLENKDLLKETLESNYSGLSVTNINAVYVGETLIGDTVKVSYNISGGGAILSYEMYYGLTNTKLTMMAGFGASANNEASKVLGNMMEQ